MYDLAETTVLKRRQDASAGESNPFLDLIANPFAAAVCSPCAFQHFAHI
jgi:hypothetical protein